MIRWLTLALLLLTSAAYAGQGAGPGPGARTYAASADTGASGWTLTDSGNFAADDPETYIDVYKAGGNPLPYYFSNSTTPNEAKSYWIEMTKTLTIRTGDTISATLSTASGGPEVFSGYLSINGTHVLSWSGSADNGVTKSVSSSAYAGSKTVVVHVQYDGGGDVDAHIVSVNVPL